MVGPLAQGARPFQVLTTADQAEPSRLTLPGQTWYSIAVKNPTILLPVSWSGNAIFFTNVRPRTDDLTNSVYYNGRRGVVYFPTQGDWWVYVSAAANENVIRLDMADPVSALSYMLALSATGILAVDLTHIGGTVQTALDVSARYQNITMDSPTTATVGAASASILAAAATRRFLYLKNTHASQRLSLGFGGAAVLDSGVSLSAGDWVAFGPFNDVTTQQVFAIGAGAGTTIAVQTGT